MSEKKTIKVVKRNQRGATTKAKSKEKTAQKTARDMVATVSSWVNDFQRKRRAETTKAIDSLMQARHQPNEA
jgi:hypothetical protein